MQIAITRPLATNRTVRAAATVLAAAAAATGVVAVTSNGSDSSPVSVSPSGGSGSSELSVYDGASLRHHGVRVIPAQQPAVPQTPAAQRFHHDR
jgi:hypothetical protein